MFLPIAIIPAILINHAGRYTLPYSKCGRPKHRYTKYRSRRSDCRGLHLAKHYKSLRNRSSVIRPPTFKQGRDDVPTKPTDPFKSSSTSSQVHDSQRSTLSTAQVNALIATDPSIRLDLFLFESKLYWESLPSLSPTSVSLTRIDAFLHSFNVVEQYHNIKSYASLSHYKSLNSTSSQFQRILLEVKGLQTSIRQYGEILPLK
jgi:hypothetical protein